MPQAGRRLIEQEPEGDPTEAGRLLRFVDAPFALVPSTSVSIFLREDVQRLARQLGANP